MARRNSRGLHGDTVGRARGARKRFKILSLDVKEARQSLPQFRLSTYRSRSYHYTARISSWRVVFAAQSSWSDHTSANFVDEV
jgi:hypothetical protein